MLSPRLRFRFAIQRYSNTLPRSPFVGALVLSIATAALFSGDEATKPARFLLAVLFVVFSVPLAWFVRRFLPPDRYAEAMLNGLKPDELLAALSYEIYKACKRNRSSVAIHTSIWRRFERDLRAFHGTATPRRWTAGLGQVIDNTPSATVAGHFRSAYEVIRPLCPETALGKLRNRVRNFELETALDQLRDCARRFEPESGRLLSMKYYVARRLDIPERRLCDHLVQYSPTVHLAQINKAVDNWEEIARRLRYGSDRTEPRAFKALVEETWRIRAEGNIRAQMQAEVQRHRYLHSHILRFSASRSASAATGHYARALEAVAMRFSTRRHRAYQTTAPPAFQEALWLLHRKQRAHEGCDLNVNLLEVCRKEHPRAFGPGVIGQNAQVALLSLLEHLRKVGHDPTYDSMTVRPWISSSPFEIQLEGLRAAAFVFQRATRRNRKRIARRFCRLCEAQYRKLPNGGQLYIVTSGYSRAVRDAIRLGLLRMLDRGSDRYGRRAARTPDDMPAVFLLRMDSSALFDGQLMERALSRWPRGFRNLGSGDVRVLEGLITSKDRVMIILGAEAFDEARNVVHPRGALGTDGELKRVLGERCGTSLVVIAESYKCQGPCLDTCEFYNQDFERVVIYRRGLVDRILTENGPL